MFRPKNKIGLIGEETVAKFLMKQGFKILARNYWKKWGEIDVVAEKEGIIRFVEVKTASCENLGEVLLTGNKYKPEDNIHPWKLKRMSKTIQSYLLEKRIENEQWQVDIAAVFVEEGSKRAKIRIIENIVL